MGTNVPRARPPVNQARPDCRAAYALYRGRMKHLLFLIALSAGCSSDPEPSGTSSSSGCPAPGTRDPISGLPVGKDCGIDAGPDARTCEGEPVGAICGGDADAGIHGECNANEVCEWTDWTCIHGSDGDACQGGHCLGGVCK